MLIDNDLAKELYQTWEEYSIIGEPQHNFYCEHDTEFNNRCTCTCSYYEDYKKWTNLYNKLIELFQKLEETIADHNRALNKAKNNPDYL